MPTLPRHWLVLRTPGSITTEMSLSAPLVRSAYSNSFLQLSCGPLTPPTFSR